MANEFKVKNGLVVDSGGATITGSIFQNASTASFGGVVGIGTTTPTYALDVIGGDLFVTSSKNIRVTNIRPADSTQLIIFQNSSGTTSGKMFMDGNIWRLASAGSYSSINIFSNGRVGISQTSDAGFAFDVNGTARIQNQLTTTGSITATSSLAQGIFANNTLVAAANNDVLVGLDVNPTFTSGAFTGVTQFAARFLSENTSGTSIAIGRPISPQNYYSILTHDYSTRTFTINSGNSGNDIIFQRAGTEKLRVTTNGITIGSSSTPVEIYGPAQTKYGLNNVSIFAQAGSSNGNYILFRDGTFGTIGALGADGSGNLQFYTLGSNTNLSSSNLNMTLFTTGNLLIQNGGTKTDAGYRLDVNGTARIQNQLTTIGSITASTALAQGIYANNTLVAAANNDVLVGLDITPTFTNGAFTGVANWGLRVNAKSLFTNQLWYQTGTNTQVISFNYNDSIVVGLSYTANAIGVNNNNRLYLRSEGDIPVGTAVSSSMIVGESTSPSSVPSAKLVVNSITQGFLSPRMTAAQKTAISAPAQGLQVYDTGLATEGIWYYNSSPSLV